MAPCRAASARQMELLLEFVESNRNVALSGVGGGPLGRQVAVKKWEDLSRKLNSVGAGCNKTAMEWKRYWTLLKSRTKGKVGDLQRGATGTRGGPNYRTPLTPIEERVISLIGKVAVEEEPEVQIPINSPDLPTQPTSPCLSPEEMEMEEIYIDEQLSDDNYTTVIGEENTTPQWAIDVENRRIESHTKIIQEMRGIKEAVREQTSAINRIGDLLSAWIEKSNPS